MCLMILLNLLSKYCLTFPYKKCWHWQMKDSIDISKYFPTPNLWQCKYSIYHPSISFASSIDLFTIHAYLCAFFCCFLRHFLSWWLWVTRFPYFLFEKDTFFFLKISSLLIVESWYWCWESDLVGNINKLKRNYGFTSRQYNSSLTFD